jgi:hypothetical protein
MCQYSYYLTAMFGLMVHNGTERNVIKWSGVERSGMEHKFRSIVWIFYDGTKLVFHSIVWKVDGME